MQPNGDGEDSIKDVMCRRDEKAHSPPIALRQGCHA
jgi:hypothetical protein